MTYDEFYYKYEDYFPNIAHIYIDKARMYDKIGVSTDCSKKRISECYFKLMVHFSHAGPHNNVVVVTVSAVEIDNIIPFPFLKNELITEDNHDLLEPHTEDFFTIINRKHNIINKLKQGENPIEDISFLTTLIGKKIDERILDRTIITFTENRVDKCNSKEFNDMNRLIELLKNSNVNREIISKIISGSVDLNKKITDDKTLRDILETYGNDELKDVLIRLDDSVSFDMI